MTELSGDLVVDVTNTVPPVELSQTFPVGSTTAILGPNGAGKSTLLRMIAGTVPAELATISFGDVVLTNDRRVVAPHRRGVGLLSQDARLFPHLDVADNVAFGPRSQGVSRAETARLVTKWLGIVGAEDLAHRRPAQLSGGQAQRVAIARAMAAQPRILLLDEPFRALDADVGGRLRALLRDLLAQESRTTIVVTHDVIDVVTLAQRAVVLENGRVVDAGPALSILQRPANSFVAQLAGVNMIRGRWDGTAVIADSIVAYGEDAEPLATNGPATATFGPDAVVLAATRPEATSFQNVWSGVVAELTASGTHVLATCAVSDTVIRARVTQNAVSVLGLSVGSNVFVAVKASAVQVY